jgi:RNA polymerase sigma-70 factor (ECF subfamily)
MPLSNESVMAQVRDGQVEKLAILFERYHVKVFNFLLRMTGDRALSEDLTQEVLNLDHLRKNHPTVAADEAPEPSAPGRAPLDDLEKRENVHRLREALARLPWKKRELLVLSRFHDMKYHEIAELMECSVPAIKVGVHRAIQDLRRMLWT